MVTRGATLPYGIYFGSGEFRQELPGFSVSLLTPDRRAEDVPLHTHDHASFVLVLSGCYLSSADGAARIPSGPMLLYNPAGTVHRDSFALASGRFLAVSVSEDSLRSAVQQADLPTSATAFAMGPSFASAMRLAQQCVASRSTNVTAMEAMCWELLAGVSGVSLWPQTAEALSPTWIRQARELLHEHCSDSLPIAAMARQLGLHPVYFARAFRQAFRCTPGEYRQRCRLREALQLLRRSTLSLVEIAASTGFCDQSHFSNAFRESFGMPPQAYRRRLDRSLDGAHAADEVQSIQDKVPDRCA